MSFYMPSKLLITKAIGLLGSFAALHAANAVIGISFNLLQFIVFSRVFDTKRFSEIVLLTAVGIYALPLSQAVGRANFVALRSNQPKIVWMTTAALLVHSVFLIGLAGISPNLLNFASPREYVESGLYVAVCLANNFWYYDLQPTFWAFDRGKAFERLTIVRRLVTFAVLPILWITGNFLFFVVFMVFTSGLFVILLLRIRPPVEARRADNSETWLLRLRNATDYLRMFWPALMSSLTELVVLNSPYALFNAAFGTGPALITYDTIMKLTRLAMTVARNLSESTVPRMTRLFASGDKVVLRRILMLLFGICGLEGLLLVLIMVMGGPFIFSLLLGPNDVMPKDTQYVAATIIFAACFYTPASYFLVFNGAQAAIQRITIISAVGLSCFAGLVLSGSLDLIGALWVYAVFFVSISALTSGLTILLVVRLEAAGNRSAGDSS